MPGSAKVCYSRVGGRLPSDTLGFHFIFFFLFVLDLNKGKEWRPRSYEGMYRFIDSVFFVNCTENYLLRVRLSSSQHELDTIPHLRVEQLLPLDLFRNRFVKVFPV